MGAVRNHKTLKDIKILCVDDNLAVLNLLKRLLKKLRVVVDIETSPRQALNKVLSHPVIQVAINHISSLCYSACQRVEQLSGSF